MPTLITLGTHRLRRGRYSEPGRAYLLTATTHNRTPHFQRLEIGRLLVAELRAAHEDGWATSLAWVVMPDHLHWLVSLQDQSLSRLMRRIKANSAREARRCLGVEATIWQKGFHDRALRRDEDLLAVSRYIVANPLRAGLARRVGDYPLWDCAWL